MLVYNNSNTGIVKYSGNAINVVLEYDYKTDTLTLVTGEGAGGWNETGGETAYTTGLYTSDLTFWNDFKTICKKIVISGNICKISPSAFALFTALETVELSEACQRVNDFGFRECPNLKTIYTKGTTPVEGTFDFLSVHQF